MSGGPHESDIDPQDPTYYAPRNLRERTVQPTAAPRRFTEPTADGPPLQSPGNRRRRDHSDVFSKAVAQAMVEKHITSPRNVIDLANYRQVVASGKASSMSARMRAEAEREQTGPGAEIDQAALFGEAELVCNGAEKFPRIWRPQMFVE